MDSKTIEHNFKYHAPTQSDIKKHQSIRDFAKSFAHLINESCIESREKSLALTKLEEVVMWANAAIARYKE
jgi:hypothetical protein